MSKTLKLHSGHKIDLVVRVEGPGYRLNLRTIKPGESNECYTATMSRDEVVELIRLLTNGLLERI